MLLIYPEDKLVVAMAGNIESSSWELPVFDIADVFMKQLHPELYPDEEKKKNSPAQEQNQAPTPDASNQPK
jgi:hypothetical protein